MTRRKPQRLYQLNMTVEKGDRPTSPVHLHVDDQTPVHVHVKKPKKPTTTRFDTSDVKTRSAAGYGASNLRRSTATAKTRSKSPAGGPWVPPPAKTTKGSKYAWQGQLHRLEINTPQDSETVQASLRLSDLDTDEEDHVTGKMRRYEKKIDGLMTEVGSLKNEVELQRTLREMGKKDDMLETSRRVLENQEAEIDVYKRDLEATETENRILRKSMDSLQEEADLTRSQRDRISSERDQLMKKLVEVEMDGQAAAKQVAALRDITRRLREDKRMSSADSAVLTKQKELLLDRLADFEGTNRSLRRLLRDRHEEEATSLRLTEQRDLLMKKLSESEDTVQRMRHGLLDKDSLISDIRLQMDAQKQEHIVVSNLQTSLETTRAHLQKELRQKDGDCNRMAVQIRTLESQLAQERIEVDHLQELLRGAKEKADRDKEALKRATRVQKQRAAKSEDALEQLNVQLMERDSIMAELHTEMEGLRSRCDKMSKEKSQALAENSGLKTRISELECIMDGVEDEAKAKVEVSVARLHEKAGEASSLKLENERLKTSIATFENKLVSAEGEMSQLRANLKQYETLLDEYRCQVNKSRREADDSIVQLEEQKRHTSVLQKENQMELDQVKTRLQIRLEELEPLPELLKTTELKLQETTDKLLSMERRHSDNTKLIAELTVKVEHQNDQLDQVRERWRTAQEENRLLENKLEKLERKLGDVEEQNRELLSTVAKREEAIHQTNMRLEEQSRENASLTRQLEAALTDTRRQSEQSREKLATKDRAAQSRILDLESQLSQTRTEVARIKREKEEAERKFNSRLYDLKDRLEQSHSTNRSMQNYVQFLKNSYANVFGESTVTTSSPIRSNFH